MWKLSVPQEVLEKLRCSLCNEYLSHMPVYSYSSEEEAVGCGRCPVLSDFNPIRNSTYESVAKFLFFPCRFKDYGCIEQNVPDQMPAHEESCSHRQYFCPRIPLGTCTWQGPANELWEHFCEQHKMFTLTDTKSHFEFTFSVYEINYLLNHNDDLFLVHFRYDPVEKMFWSSVRYIGNKKAAKQYCYQIEFTANNTFEKICLEKKVVESDLNMNLDKTTAVNIDMQQIKLKLDDPLPIVCFINIFENVQSCDLIDLISKCTTISMESKVDEEILRELECPICNEYMVPPIHQCVSGHSICAECRSRIKECPTCRKDIQDTRNYSLEKLTRFIHYCCKYHDYGCKFTSGSDNIRMHENTCKYGPYDCPFRGYNDCKWNGQLCEFMKHATNDHEDNIMKVDIITFPYSNEAEPASEECFIRNMCGNIFRLLFRYEDQEFFWSIQYIGPPEDASKFQYELDIIDNSEDNQRLFIKKKCGPLTEYKDAFANEDYFLCLDIELLRPFINKNALIYKCHILEKY